MTNRDFNFWLHGLYELGKQTHFYSYQVLTIKDHIRAVEDPGEFVHWLKGAIETAQATNTSTSKFFFSAVGEKLDTYFVKHTPDRKKEIVEAVDEVLKEKDGVDYQHMTDMLRRERENMQLHHDLSPYRPRKYC